MARLGRQPGWLRQEIVRVEAALARYNKECEAIAQEWARSGYPCCPSCWSRRYSDLADKTERVEAWLKILKERLAKAEANRAKTVEKLTYGGEE